MNYSKAIFLLFTFLSFSIFCSAQNLIPNPSLEDENICHFYKENCAPRAWRSNSLKAFLYFDYKISGVRKEAVKPADGTRCISLRVFNHARAENRSYAQTPFLCQLEKGKKYKLQFQVLSQHYYLKQLEVLLLETIFITKDNEGLFDTQPQIQFDFDKPLPINEWVTLEKEFVATGNEVGMMIGNFNRDEETEITYLRKKKRKFRPPNRTYYYFDNFSLTAIDSLEMDCDLERNRTFIYADSVRHLIKIPPQSVQIIPEFVPIVEEVKASPPSTPEPKPKEEVKFIPLKKFILPNILFATNSERLLPVSYNSLDELIVYLKENKYDKIQITGHTDNVGKSYANQILSENRAKSVANYLITNGIHISRILTNGKGETQPISTNETEEGRRGNRRVEFEIIK